MPASRRASFSSRVLAAPVIEASGVRRSCETELSSELRSRSVSTRTCAALRFLGEPGPLDGQRGLVGEGLELVELLRRLERRGSGGRSPSTPTVPREPVSGT